MAQIAAVYGSSNCSENLRRMSCGFTCDPNNAAFITLSTTPFTLTGSFDTTFVQNVYNTCKGRCASTQNRLTFAMIYGTNSSGTVLFLLCVCVFLAYFRFSSAWLASLDVPAVGTNPAVNFVTSSSGTAFTTATVNVSAADQMVRTTCACHPLSKRE